jgi:hypothetical protein
LQSATIRGNALQRFIILHNRAETGREEIAHHLIRQQDAETFPWEPFVDGEAGHRIHERRAAELNGVRQRNCDEFDEFSV